MHRLLPIVSAEAEWSRRYLIALQVYNSSPVPVDRFETSISSRHLGRGGICIAQMCRPVIRVATHRPRIHRHKLGVCAGLRLFGQAGVLKQQTAHAV